MIRGSSILLPVQVGNVGELYGLGVGVKRDLYYAGARIICIARDEAVGFLVQVSVSWCDDFVAVKL